MISIILAASILVLNIAVLVALARKYIRTRDIGFVWLGVAVLVWPLTSFLLRQWESVALSGYSHGKALLYYPFSLVERGQMSFGDLILRLNQLDQFVGACLLLVAVLYLSRPQTDNGRLRNSL